MSKSGLKRLHLVIPKMPESGTERPYLDILKMICNKIENVLKKDGGSSY